MMHTTLQNDLDQMATAGLMRTLTDKTGAINFCSNDYLGLAGDPRLSDAAVMAMKQYGFGSRASRLVTGQTQPVELLEQTIAKQKQVDECLVFNSGYSANTGIIPALMSREDIIFSDKLNHASIVDGILLSRAEFKRYPHCDMAALEEALKQSGKHRRRLIVTDKVFSMDGDVAPMATIIDLAKRYDAWVMVDQAHSFGVLEDSDASVDIQMGTLSKAAGCFGAYVCGKSPLRSYLINHARSFIYTTALPAAVTEAARAAVNIIGSSEGVTLRKKVLSNADYVRQQLKQMGFDTLQSTTPIIPVILKDATRAVAASQELYKAGIYVSAIRPPTVPVNTARLRITVTAKHTQAELDMLVNAMRKI